MGKLQQPTGVGSGQLKAAVTGEAGPHLDLVVRLRQLQLRSVQLQPRKSLSVRACSVALRSLSHPHSVSCTSDTKPPKQRPVGTQAGDAQTLFIARRQLSGTEAATQNFEQSLATTLKPALRLGVHAVGLGAPSCCSLLTSSPFHVRHCLYLPQALARQLLFAFIPSHQVQMKWSIT